MRLDTDRLKKERNVAIAIAIVVVVFLIVLNIILLTFHIFNNQ